MLLAGVFRSAISLVVLVVEGTRGIDYLFGVILSVVMANFVANHIHHDGVYESELERIGNVYMLRDEPPHRLFTLTSEAIMATGVYGYRWVMVCWQLLRSSCQDHNQGLAQTYMACMRGVACLLADRARLHSENGCFVA